MGKAKATGLDIEEFRGFLKIDRDNLDEEIEQQASLYYTVASEAARVQSRADKIENQLKRVSAGIDADVRKKADKKGEKLTENMVKARVSQHDDHKTLSKDLLKEKRRFDQLSALSEAFKQRSWMLRELVNLYVSGYFADSAVRGPREDAKGRRAERNLKKMAEKRNRKHL